MTFAPAAAAIEWRLEPNVSTTATYSDNANQSATDPEDALILTVMPGFNLTSEGSRRVQATLQYAVRGVARFGEGDDSDLDHNLNAAGKAELIEDFLFIDASARISQELISLLGSPSDADVNDSNRTTVGTYSISPYIQKRFGTFADAQVRYTTSGAIFEDQAAADSAANSLTATLTSGTRFSDLSWGLNYSIRKAENRNASDAAFNEDVTFERTSASIGYLLSRKFRVFGTVGRDQDDYLSTTETDGFFYSAGFGWAPSRRTSIEVAAGEHYFGPTYSVSGSHRTRKSRWSLRYAEDVSDITQQFLEQTSRIFWICDGTLIETGDDPGGCVGPVTAGQLAQFFSDYGVSEAQLVAAGLLQVSTANGIFLSKSLNAGVSWDVGRLAFGLSAYDTRRLYLWSDGAEEHVRGMTGAVSYRLSPRTSANSSLTLTRTEVDDALLAGASREDDLLTFSLGLNHLFAETLSGALTFHHTQRDSNEATADYEENRLTASVNMRF